MGDLSNVEPDDHRRKILRDTVARMEEHFDAVVILATRVDEDGNTQTYKDGSGNWNTRLGLLHHAVNDDIAIRTEFEVRRHIDG